MSYGIFELRCGIKIEKGKRWQSQSIISQIMAIKAFSIELSYNRELIIIT